MNFQYSTVLTPLRVMIVNPLVPASQLTISKMLAGTVFGINQLLDLVLLVYSNELTSAQEYIQEVISCAFPCFNSIRATSDLPSITDADVFCFITNLSRPNYIDFFNVDSIEQFDTFYLMIKIANSLGKPVPEEDIEKGATKKIKPVKRIRPIIVSDGLVVLDILWSMSQNLPPEIFFCATPLRSIAKTLLSDYLKVECYQINDVYAWAANDEVFHVEIKRPYLINDKLHNELNCEWDAVGKELLEKIGLDHVQFNASWMKKEFIEKIVNTAAKNPYGCIYKAAEMSKTIRYIWTARCSDENLSTSLGVISDGSLGTAKGLPYVLPVIFSEDKWVVNTEFAESSHLKNEIKRINIAVQEHHKKLIPYCKKFLEENVIKKAFVPTPETPSETGFTTTLEQSSIRSDVI